MTIRAPAAAGDYVLAIDLVKEGVTWFSEAGKPWHTRARRRSTKPLTRRLRCGPA